MPRYFVTLIVAVALFMETMDSTVIATSLPAIAADLHQDPIALKLALTSYLLSLAVFIPLSGWMADRFGARTVFRAAIVVFTLGSALCGFAQGLGDFVLFRVIQGMGGAMMVPVGRLVILRTVPKAELISALAWLTIPALMGPVIGPPLGGFITTYISWRWIFWINIPVGLVGITLATLYVANIREEGLPPLDVKGFILSGIGLAGLAFGFTTIGQGLFPPAVIAGLFAAGIVGCTLYVRHARTAPAPLLDLDLLKVDTFFASVVGGFLYRIGVGALPFLLPLMLQLGFGLNPMQSGLLTFASAVGAVAMKTTAAPILRRFGFKRVLVTNAVVSSLFLAAIALFTAGTPALVDSRRAPGRRLLQVARIHQHQLDRLCRYRFQGDEPGDELRQRGAAAFALRRRRHRRAGARGAAHGPWQRRRGGGRFPARLRAGRRHRGNLLADLRHAAEGGRRQPLGPRPRRRRAGGARSGLANLGR